MTSDISEEGEPYEFCGTPISFLDDDWTVCPNCQAEFRNMDYVGGVINEVRGVERLARDSGRL
jgi:hypothetical protein